jgi:iron complex transport system ATP-binding protein
MSSETRHGPTAVEPPALEARALGVRFGDRWVLRDVDLAIRPGERVCLVGPNGAGKSTLIRCLTGLQAPTTGRALLAAVDVGSVDRPALSRRLAVVPGQARLPFAMTVEEMVALGRTPWLHPWRGETAADRAAVRAAMRRVGIDGLRDRDVRTLSLGERQLVLIATALGQGGRILVLDEPTVHLDLRHQVGVMELLVRLSEEGMTVLAVLHDLALARESFPRLVLLDGGRIVADGTPADVLTAERVREVYGVEPRYVTGVGGGVPAGP